MSRIIAAHLHNNVTRRNLLNITRAVVAEKKIPLDRTAKRSKDGLLCWLCEVAPELANSSTPGPSLDLKSSVSDPICKETESESDSDWVDIGLDEDLRKEEDAMLRAFFSNDGVGAEWHK
jgi:hypothetical protein